MIKSKIIFIGAILLITFSLLFAAGCQKTDSTTNTVDKPTTADTTNSQKTADTAGENLQPPALPTE